MSIWRVAPVFATEERGLRQEHVGREQPAQGVADERSLAMGSVPTFDQGNDVLGEEISNRRGAAGELLNFRAVASVELFRCCLVNRRAKFHVSDHGSIEVDAIDLDGG